MKYINKLKGLMLMLGAGLCLLSQAAHDPSAFTGTGTEGDPFMLASRTDILTLSAEGSIDSAYYKMANEIDMIGDTISGIGPAANGDGEFHGFFDGDGYYIKNLTLVARTTGAWNHGFIPTLRGGWIKNFGLINSNFIGAANSEGAGILVGMVGAGTLVENCYTMGGTLVAFRKSGGLAGFSPGGTIRDCYSSARVEITAGWAYGAGIVSYIENGATLENVFFNGELYSPNNETPLRAIFSEAKGTPNNIRNAYVYEFFTRDLGPDGIDTLSGHHDSVSTVNNVGDPAQFIGFDFDTDSIWTVVGGEVMLSIIPSYKPTAVAGDDQSSFEGHQVQFIATASQQGSTFEGLYYLWEVDGYPGATINGRYVRKEWPIEDTVFVFEKTFYDTVNIVIPDLAQDDTLNILLRAYDSRDTSAYDTALVFVRTADDNLAPTQTVSDDLSVQYQRPVTLTTMAEDGDGDDLTYEWVAPSSILVSGTSDSEISFTAPYLANDTSYIFYITTSDNPFGAQSATDSVVVEVIANVAPVVSATAPVLTVTATDLVRLGATVIERNGDEVSYSWTAPAGIVLSDTAIAEPSFTAPHVSAEQVFTMTVTVNDGFLNSVPSLISITVLPKEDNLYAPDALESFSEASIKLYPNPSNGLLNIELPGQAQLSVMNLLGDVLYTQDVEAGLNRLDISELPGGIYLISLQANNQRITKKIQVQ